jgi:hypothetical protein
MKALRALGSNPSLRKGVMSELLEASCDNANFSDVSQDVNSTRDGNEDGGKNPKVNTKDVTPPAEKLRALWQEMQRSTVAAEGAIANMNSNTLISFGSEVSSAFSADSVTTQMASMYNSNVDQMDSSKDEKALALQLQDLVEDEEQADARNGSDGYVQKMVIRKTARTVAVKSVIRLCPSSIVLLSFTCARSLSLFS